MRAAIRDDVIIVGAPRSGTNMLRDVLTSLPGYGTWNCDEINLVWRHGNRSYPSDELPPELATPSVKRFLRNAFASVRARSKADRVVEKTCANSLRVPFVAEVAPEARYIFIARDGLDATVSAVDRWHAPLELGYTARKARYVPIGDVPYYGRQFLQNRLRQRGGGTERAPGWWGPKPRDWAELGARPIDELAMIQWQRCVELARAGLDTLPDEQVFHVRYEEFVSDPLAGLETLLDFLGDRRRVDPAIVLGVTDASVGRGRSRLPAEAHERLVAIAGDTLKELGYAR